MFNLILLLFVPITYLIWSVPFLLLKLVGIHLFRESNPARINGILDGVSKFSSITENEKQSGWIFYWNYIIYVHDTEATPKLFILTTKAKFAQLSMPKKTGPKVVCMTRTGNFLRLVYSKKFAEYNRKPLPHQIPIMEKITKKYKKHNGVTMFLNGEPGSGKSNIAYLLAAQLNGIYCSSFNPFESGDDFESLYQQSKPSATQPLIVVLEEIDTQLAKIKEPKKQHKLIPTLIYDKTSFNNFMDKFDIGEYKYVILIMTSNKRKYEIDEIDASFLREGRVKICAELNKPKVK